MITTGGIFNVLNISKGSSIFPSGGGEITFVDGDTVISFSANSTLTVYEPTTIQHFLIGGGGAGAIGNSADEGQGAGGAGEVLSGYTTLSAGTYAITIGAGGTNWTSGTSSSIGSSLIARGGKTPTGNGANGADGYNGFVGGGGVEIRFAGSNAYGHGGGGAGSTQNGQQALLIDPEYGAFGGSGTTTNIRGYSEQFAGGGGGGITITDGDIATGIGVFGGGNGTVLDINTNIQATSARVNSGAGGGGSKDIGYGYGGSGIVIIRYLTV